MKLGQAQVFLHQNTIWLIRGLGAFVGLILPPYRYLFPEASFDPMWMRWALSAIIFSVIIASFVSARVRRKAMPATYLFCILLTVWMLVLAFANGLAQSYASSYQIMLFASLILMRDWRWLLPVVVLHTIGVIVGALLVENPVFSPLTFAVMAITILLIASAGIATGWLEYWSVSQRELRLRSINRAAFGTATDAIVVTDVSGEVLTYNAVFHNFWRNGDEKPGDSTVSSWIPLLQGKLLDPSQILRINSEAHLEPTKNISELLALRDGRFVKLRSQPVIENEETLGRIWFFRDVTKSRRNAEAMEQAHERLRRQNAALVKLSLHEEMLGSDFEAALRLVTQEVVYSLDADRGAVWRLENANQQLVCEDIFFRALDIHQKGTVVSAGQSPAYFEKLATERVIHIPHANRNPLTKGFQLPYLVGERERNVLDVPLRIAGRLHGVLSAEREGQDWTIEDQQFLASVGDLLAVFFESLERRKAETQLANSIALLKAVFESTGVGILVTRPDRTLIDCNNTYLNIFDLDRDFAFNGEPDEVIAASRRQLVDSTSVVQSMRFLMSNPDQNHTENLVFKDGRIVERFTEVLRVRDDVVGRVWFYRDVTERVRADAVILESQQRNKAIIEAIPDLIARVDPAGTILDLKMPESGPLSQLFPKEDGANLAAFFPEEFVAEAIRQVQLALTSGDLVAYECELELQGNLRDLEIRLTPSGPGEALLMARDVTERKKTERELVQRNHELDSFVYRASHDLKAPLNSLMGLIEILKSESKDPELATYLHLMDKSVIKLDTFIRNLTEFSKIARLEIRNQGVDFNELIAEVGEGLKYMENAGRVAQQIELSPGPAFIGDSFHIGIVLGNLLSNAVKYQDLKKPDPWVKVTVNTTPEECQITVEDNGVGIAAAHQGRIFELFYRASNQSFGSGLGLYITRNAVEKMKGTIEMFSEEGVGTKFVVSLPNLNIAVDKG